jgi:hypothetical protein
MNGKKQDTINKEQIINNNQIPIIKLIFNIKLPTNKQLNCFSIDY